MEKVLDESFWDDDVKVYRNESENITELRLVVGSESRVGFDREEYVFNLREACFEFVHGFSVEKGFLTRCYPDYELVDFVDKEVDLGFQIKPVN